MIRNRMLAMALLVSLFLCELNERSHFPALKSLRGAAVVAAEFEQLRTASPLDQAHEAWPLDHTHEEAQIQQDQRTTSAPAVLAPELSFVMPMYNEAQFAPSAIGRLLETARPVEIVAVDDGSRDDTLSRVRSMSDARLQVIANPQSRGYHGAVRQGVLATKGEFVIVAEVEYRLMDLAPLIVPLQDEDTDAVYVANPAVTGPLLSSMLHRLTNLLATLLVGAAGPDIHPFCIAYKGEFIRGLARQYASPTHLVARAFMAAHRMRVVEVPFEKVAA